MSVGGVERNAPCEELDGESVAQLLLKQLAHREDDDGLVGVHLAPLGL